MNLNDLNWDQMRDDFFPKLDDAAAILESRCSKYSNNNIFYEGNSCDDCDHPLSSVPSANCFDCMYSIIKETGL